MVRRKKWIVAGVAVSALTLGGAGLAVATGGGDDSEPPITGPAYEKAARAALAHTGGGRVTDTEVGDEDSFYEVEVTLDGGRRVDVQLDERFQVVGSDPDEEEPGDDEEGDDEGYAPAIDPAQFTTRIDNELLPLVPGRRWVYEAATDEGTERIVVEVTRRTRKVMGVTTLVVRDTVTLDGELVEDTFDWFAQDAAGNVWYFGEDTKEYDGGEVSAAGSWEAGVDGAQPGIVMKADPQPGDRYRQEYYAGEAEDMAQVIRVNGEATVPFGTFGGVVVTKDWTPLERGVMEHKYYAPGVGLVLEVAVTGGNERVELVEMTG